MRELILNSLKSGIDHRVAEDLLLQYEVVLAEYRKGDPEAALNASGKFVEHTVRAIEFIRTGRAPHEINSLHSTLKEIDRDNRLSEALRVSIPRVASMIFDLRSKRGAAHVKEIDPRHIDAALLSQAASWIISEFIRLFHDNSEKAVAQAMAVLMRGNIPLIEEFGDEVVITTPLPCDVEVLLRVFAAEPAGIDRRGLGASVKQSPSTITRSIQRLEQEIYLHKMKNGTFRITGRGERALGDAIAAISGSAIIPGLSQG